MLAKVLQYKAYQTCPQELVNTGVDQRRRGNVHVAGRLDQKREALCLAQYELDIELCRMSKSQLCWGTAMQRRAACITNDFIPELRH